MKSKGNANNRENDTRQTEEKASPSKDFFEQLQENNPTMTLDEIGNFFLNTYLFKRKFKMPK